MHWTTHVTAGAACGYLVGRPVPAFLAGLAGHALMDITPHHDPEEDSGYVIDSAAGLSFVTALALNGKVRGSRSGRAAIWGAAGAGLPDVELLSKLFFDVRQEQYLFPTHNRTLPHREADRGISTVIEVSLVCFLILLALGKALRAGAGPGGREG